MSPSILWAAVAVGVSVGGCADGGAPVDGRSRAFENTPTTPAPPEAREGAWTLPAEVRAAGERQSGSYVEAGPWDDGAGCAGDLEPGTRALGERVIERFGAGLRYAGYACAPSRTDPGRLSMVATGRVLVIAVPSIAGEADNALGDPVANHMVEHASELGIQLIVWDETKWNISYSGRKDAPFTGEDPHHEHIRIELTPDGARGRIEGPGDDAGAPGSDAGAPDAGPPAPPPPPPSRPLCDDSCFFAFDGDCDDGGPGSDYDLCEYGSDCADCGERRR